LNFDEIYEHIKPAVHGDKPDCDDICQDIKDSLNQFPNINDYAYINALSEAFASNFEENKWFDLYDMFQNKFRRYAFTNPDLLEGLRQGILDADEVYNALREDLGNEAQFDSFNNHITDFVPAIFMKQCREAFYDTNEFQA